MILQTKRRSRSVNQRRRPFFLGECRRAVVILEAERQEEAAEECEFGAMKWQWGFSAAAMSISDINKGIRRRADQPTKSADWAVDRRPRYGSAGSRTRAMTSHAECCVESCRMNGLVASFSACRRRCSALRERCIPTNTIQ